jgi:hypothetical protein
LLFPPAERPTVLLAETRQWFIVEREAKSSSHLNRLTDYLCAAGLPLSRFCSGAFERKVRDAEYSKFRFEIS